MRIDYNILWFEDIRSSFNAKKRIVKAIVEDYGFNFPEPRNEINGDNIDDIDYDHYDLLIADLNLAGTKGPALINRIRNYADVHTEVIFYSSDGETAVRTALREYQIDGAYFAGRDNDDFEDKVKKVIKTTIKKVQDLNNMRGLIMAETSDIDHIMLTIIKLVIDKNVLGIKQSLTDEIFTNVDSKVSNKKREFDRMHRNKRIDHVLKDNVMFDASQKLLAMQFIIDRIDSEAVSMHKSNNFTTTYTEIKSKRDLLAHVVEIYVEGKRILRSGNKELDFTDDFCNDIRRKVTFHSSELTKILELLEKL